MKNTDKLKPGKWMSAKIKKHTQLRVGNNLTDCWHKDMIGKIIRVRYPGWNSSFFDVSTGESILKSDVEVF